MATTTSSSESISPFTRVVYIARILSFLIDTPQKLIQLSHVSASFRETVQHYLDSITWARLAFKVRSFWFRIGACSLMPGGVEYNREACLQPNERDNNKDSMLQFFKRMHESPNAGGEWIYTALAANANGYQPHWRSFQRLHCEYPGVKAAAWAAAAVAWFLRLKRKAKTKSDNNGNDEDDDDDDRDKEARAVSGFGNPYHLAAKLLLRGKFVSFDSDMLISLIGHTVNDRFMGGDDNVMILDVLLREIGIADIRAPPYQPPSGPILASSAPMPRYSPDKSVVSALIAASQFSLALFIMQQPWCGDGTCGRKWHIEESLQRVMEAADDDSETVCELITQLCKCGAVVLSYSRRSRQSVVEMASQSRNKTAALKPFLSEKDWEAALAPRQAKATMTETTSNIFPSAVLANSTRSAVCVELRSGVTIVGTLTKCDGWMNLVLSNVLRYSADGTQSWKTPEVCVRGNSVKTIRVDAGAVRQKDPQQYQQQGAASAGGGGQHAGARRTRSGEASSGGGGGGQRMSADDRSKKYGKPRPK